MPKYRVELSRTIGQEAVCYVDARHEEEAMDTAMDWAIEGDLVWHEDDDEPHNVCVEAAVLSEDIDSRKPRGPRYGTHGRLDKGYPPQPHLNTGEIEQQFAVDAAREAVQRLETAGSALSIEANVVHHHTGRKDD